MADSIPEVSVAAEKLVEWNDNFNTSILTFIIATIVFLALTFGVSYFANLHEIAKNFGKYRCNPAFMPFAGQFGYDARENFNFCISNILNDQIAGAFAPLYKMLSQFTGIMTVMMNAVLGIRKLFSNFFLSVNNFIGNVRNKIQNLLFQIRLSFMKMNNLMARVFGTMYAIIFMGTSALTAGSNLANNDLVMFMMEFCFDPNTPILMESGETKLIKDVKIGDRLVTLSDGTTPEVTSTFVFDGAETPVVSLDGVILSTQHYVQYNETWITAGSHPSAVPAVSCEKLICLNVSGNVFRVGSLYVRDYDEHVSPGVVEAAQSIALTALNGKSDTQTITDYSLGFDGALYFKTSGGDWKAARDIVIGDTLASAGRVLGTVREVCEECVKLPSGAIVSSAQLLFEGGKWVRAGIKYKEHIIPEPQTLYQFITANCGTLIARHADTSYHLRDYREVPLPEMESPYEAELASSPSPAAKIICP